MFSQLIVDDMYEIGNRSANCFPWNDISFEVIGQLENGIQALKFIRDNHVDVIFCGIIVPEISVLDMMKELCIQKAKLAVVFLNGYKDCEYAQKSTSCNVKNNTIKSVKYSELMDVFLKIKDELCSSQEKAKPENSLNETDKNLSINDKIIITIKEYVKEHWKNTTLETAAKLVHMNPYYLSRFFKEKTGQKFSDFVTEVRMEKASKLLMDINYKIYEVCDRIGYNSTKSFSRSFRKFFGKSPKEYRTMNSTRK